MIVKMLKEYGRLLVGNQYSVDNSTGKNLISMGLAKVGVVKSKKRRRKKRKPSVVKEANLGGSIKGVG